MLSSEAANSELSSLAAASLLLSFNGLFFSDTPFGERNYFYGFFLPPWLKGKKYKKVANRGEWCWSLRRTTTTHHRRERTNEWIIAKWWKREKINFPACPPTPSAFHFPSKPASQPSSRTDVAALLLLLLEWCWTKFKMYFQPFERNHGGGGGSGEKEDDAQKTNTMYGGGV